MTPKGIFHPSPWDVTVVDMPSRRDIDHQKACLEEEGQIEPIVVDYNTKQVVLDEYPYADAQIIAARELGWPTILITFENRSD